MRAGKYADDKVRQSERRVGVGTGSHGRIGRDEALRIRFCQRYSISEDSFRIGLNALTFFVNIARIGGLGDNFIGVRV